MALDTELSAYVTVEDIRQFERRVLAEGMQFLTVTLPALGKALDASFNTGVFVCPSDWRPAKDRAYPMFLHKAWECLFSSNGQAVWVVPGQPHNELLCAVWKPLGAAVACLRQLTYCFYKYERPWTEDQAAATFEAFKNAEDEVVATEERLLNGGFSEKIGKLDIAAYIDRAKRLIAALLTGSNPHDIKPQYGTGATACKSTPEGRWVKPRFIPKLDRVYPYTEWFVSGINGLDEILYENRLELETCERPGARVVLVPKDSRGPRLISAEPREFMYIQKGLMAELYAFMERYPNVRRQVSCTDQSRNQLLALIGSQTGGLATLDLKEASDRVPWWLVKMLFPSNWVECFNACRSEFTVLPSGEEIPLRKFAPMGSACCFPVEALVFWALCHAANPAFSGRLIKGLLRRSGNSQMKPEPYTSVWGFDDVCVFGDDIIVPTSSVDTVVQLFEAVGLVVNTSKSFTSGPFRESCGMDYFAGYLVTPQRVKNVLAGDSIMVMFRTKDVFNNIAHRYGSSCPSLIGKLQELFNQFFGLSLPIFPLREDRRCTGLCLIDTHWGQRVEGQTLVRDKRLGVWRAGNVRVRLNNPDRRTVDYNRLQARLLVEIPVKESHDLTWWSVLRSFLLSGGRGGTDEYTIRGRVRHKTAWVEV